MEAIGERTKERLPDTITVEFPDVEVTPEIKKRRFRNLHRQLNIQLKMAEELGTMMLMDDAFVEEVQSYATKRLESWEEMEMELLEPRMREIVKELIKQRKMEEQARAEEESRRHLSKLMEAMDEKTKVGLVAESTD